MTYGHSNALLCEDSASATDDHSRGTTSWFYPLDEAVIGGRSIDNARAPRSIAHIESAVRELLPDSLSSLMGDMRYLEMYIPDISLNSRIALESNIDGAVLMHERNWFAFIQGFAKTSEAEGWVTCVSRAAGRIERLRPEGQDNPDVVWPTSTVLKNFELISGYLPNSINIPDIEIDDSVGSISLVWVDSSVQRSFSLTIPSGGEVIGVITSTSPARSASWKLPVSDDRKIVGKIEMDVDAKELVGL